MNSNSADYYRGNLLLKSLSNNSIFFVPRPGTWNVVYADFKNNPSVILNIYENKDLFDVKFSKNNWFGDLQSGELIINGRNSFLIRWNHSHNFLEVNPDELYLEFLKRNLVVSKNYRGKPFNSKASSEYHEWQSHTKFVGGITDIDLLRINEEGVPTEIIEIKRSRIKPNEWYPYFQDAGGYEILDKLCSKLSIEFSTIYYHYDPKLGIEDIENLQLFKKKAGFNFEKMGSLSLKEFVEKSY